MGDVLDVTSRFDGAAVWARLSSEQQTALGVASLEVIAAERGVAAAVAAGRDDWERPCLAAHAACTAAAERAFAGAVGADALFLPGGQPRIPSLLGMVCRGCGWAAENLCTACAPADTESGGAP